MIVLGLLVGGGLRLVPSDAAAASGPDAAGDAAAPTACAAK
jgi:hypothetical protein